MGKVRVFELARELGVDNQVVLDLCERLKISVNSHRSSIDDPLAARVRRLAESERLGPQAESRTVLEMLASFEDRGFITTGEIFAVFPDVEPGSAELAAIFSAIRSRDVDIVDEIAEELQREDDARHAGHKGAGAGRAHSAPAAERIRGAPSTGDDVPLRDLLAAGEGPRLEFKETARFNVRSNQRDKEMDREIVKTVAGFMNADGGTLIVGVTDAGEVAGLERDYGTLGTRQNRDGFFNAMTTMLTEHIKEAFVALYVRVRIEAHGAYEVCRVDVRAADEPVFVDEQSKESAFHVRVGNSTRRYNHADFFAYAKKRWHL